jgi:bifunctional non-homologous end joining protein LigD
MAKADKADDEQGEGQGRDKDKDADKLGQYRAMRDFTRTKEPSGPDPADAHTGNRFVVQEHHATALHWDFRLERDGVLVSWAVPKGIPPDPWDNRMAVHTEDHPLDYIDFAGEIPEGEYGGGQVHLWDQGTYECEKFNEREVIVVLDGRRVHGRYALIKTKGKNWLMHRMDPPEDPTRERFPKGLKPMRPTAARHLPKTGDHLFEPDWGGLHVLLASEGGRVELTDEEGGDPSARFPEFHALGRALGSLNLVLDGQVVVLGSDGRPDPALLTKAKRSAEHPALFFAGDLVWLDGHTAASLPYRNRRTLLEQLDFEGPSWRIGPAHQDGAALLSAAADQGLAGVVAKAADAPYEPKQQSPNALRIPAQSPPG